MEHCHEKTAASVTTHVEHCIVPCRRSFAEAKAALEAAVPLLDRTYQRHLDIGNLAAAGEALRMLPLLNRFGAQPRDFGPVMRAEAATVTKEDDNRSRGSKTGIKDALQYEIGNPHKAAQMVRLRGQTALYAPIRVALLQAVAVVSTQQEAKEGPAVSDQVWFEYARPSSTMGQTGIREVDDIARGLDEAMHEVLVKAAGLESGAERVESKI